MRTQLSVALLVLAIASPARAQVEPTKTRPSADDPSARPARLTIEFTTLRILRDKRIITEAEYESALHDVVDSVGDQGGESLTLVVGKWSTTMYGFVEADNIWDSTESFNDLAGNTLIQRGTAYSGNNGRFQMGVRNSRIGFRLRAPEFHRVRASAMLEMDFLGNQPGVGYAQPYQISEGAFFTNPAFRIRHMNLKVETPIVDILFGQYWHLFGWQSTYHPNTVEIQGVPGQIYSRTPQIRISKTIKTDAITVDFAAAMMRPPQRDSSTPEGQAGVHIALNKWTAVDTVGPAGTSIQPLSVAVTADVRQFNLPNFAAKPTFSVGATGWGVAVDAFAPILRATKKKKGNSLAVHGEFAYGYGIADLYTNLNGGVGNAALPNPMLTMPAPTYTVDADPSFVVFNADGTAHLINWQSGLVGVQYWLPGNSRVFVSANYTHLSSNNAPLHPASATTPALSSEDWADGNLFFDATPAVRLGLEYAWFHDTFADNTFADNHRVQFSAFYIY